MPQNLKIKHEMKDMDKTKGEIVMYQPDETIRPEVRVENETVWLSQVQMAELFPTTKQNISLHVNNIFKEGELNEFSTVKEYLTVQKEDHRFIQRNAGNGCRCNTWDDKVIYDGTLCSSGFTFSCTATLYGSNINTI